MQIKMGIYIDCLLLISHLFIRNILDINWSKIKENGFLMPFPGLSARENPQIFLGLRPQTPAAARSAVLHAILLGPHEISLSGTSSNQI